jgi:HisJ family histidinol phosphate phosphatase
LFYCQISAFFIIKFPRGNNGSFFMLYKTDYHIHTSFSDGKAAPENYIAPAISAGLSEIGFSEHLSLFRENQDWVMHPEKVNEYIAHIDNLKKNVKNITVRTGLERSRILSYF